ncbi:hypothetical protein BGZ52_011147 [Haplosporangium bisporale]|nr:hypothetical protein BGZ52_011147 [Haplosporangium bisporale]
MPSKLILWITIGAAVQAMASGAPTNNNVICTTQQCVLAAADIIRDMNPDVNPCVDFNQYASIIRKIVDPTSPSTPKAAPGDEAAANNIKKI